MSKYFSWSRKKWVSWVKGRWPREQAFGKWSAQSGGEWFSKALGGPVGSDYMCVWHHAQGRSTKEFPPEL